MKARARAARLAVGLAWAAVAVSAAPAAAHAPGTSTGEILVSERALEVRFRLDLGLLARLAWPDGDGDGRVTRQEIEAIAPRVTAYLGRRIEVSLDDGPPSLGGATGVLWPPGLDAVPTEAWPATLVGFAFERPLADLPALVTIRYDVWPELGLGHRNWTTIREQGAAPLVVEFSRDEPDYDYYTEGPGPGPSALFLLCLRRALQPAAPALVLLALLLSVARARAAAVAAAFALGHSITLALSALGVIAATGTPLGASGLAICAVALTARLLGRGLRRGRALAFGVGASQGLEIARPLVATASAGSPPLAGLAASLLAFHLGLEAGLLALTTALAVTRAAIAGALSRRLPKTAAASRAGSTRALLPGG